jgi:chromosomal replication initiator protein
VGGEAILLVSDIEHLWKNCAEALRLQLSDATWRTWFEGIVATGEGDDRLILTVPSALVRDRFESRFLPLVSDVLADTAGRDYDVVLRVASPEQRGAAMADLQERLDLDERLELHEHPDLGALDDLADDGLDHQDFVTSDRRRRPHPANRTPPAPDIGPGLNTRYTFEGFVIGASNRFAHAATLAVAERPAKSWNPLFIYGGPGLGKTHLLHAIGHFVSENYPQYKVRYASAETFTNEFIDSLRSNTSNNFKRRYRECDVLLIDDIQFMEGKESTKEEFFHTFNILHEGGHQIVITSDRPPKSLSDLEDRLRSRFEMGLVTDVQPPELETRLAILRKKAEREPLPVPNDVLEFIATNVTDNIRVLEGALIRVSAFASLNHEPLDEELARRVLGDLFAGDQPQVITPKLILDSTAKHFGFTVDELCGTSRRRPLVTARQIGMYVFRDMTDFSYPAIAREFGGRDHTTVIYAVEKVSTLMREKRAIYDQVTELIRTIRRGS